MVTYEQRFTASQADIACSARIDEGNSVPPIIMTRRGLFGFGVAAAAAVVLPDTGLAAPLVDPYSGSIPLVSPLAEGTYQTPLPSNWHVGRQGQTYPWNHTNDTALRAHDGIDAYPASAVLPAVYAPLTGMVAAVCLRSANTPDASVTYAVSNITPPPWDFSQATDDVANRPLYGNFVWLYSTESASRGYFIFFCHLQNEPILRSLVPDQPVSAESQIGVLGDSGNAVGNPQLHVEIHYPQGLNYTCSHCAPGRELTSINPEASLRQAVRRLSRAS